jgi:adenylate kinase
VNLILFGPPGAGKGTQAHHIVVNHKYFQLSTGDLLRNEIKKKTSLGQNIEKIISDGKFVSDDVVNILLLNAIQKQENKNKIIFDGYPRNISQAKNLEQILNKGNQIIERIIVLNVSREIIQKRILGRITCEKCNVTLNEFFNQEEIENHACGKENLKKRRDDNQETVITRYDTYMEKTKPVLDFYSNHHGYHEIDGGLKIEEIKGKIDQILRV